MRDDHAVEVAAAQIRPELVRVLAPRRHAVERDHGDELRAEGGMRLEHPLDAGRVGDVSDEDAALERRHGTREAAGGQAGRP